MIVLNILGYFGRNKQNSYAALISLNYFFQDGDEDVVSACQPQAPGLDLAPGVLLYLHAQWACAYTGTSRESDTYGKR